MTSLPEWLLVGGALRLLSVVAVFLIVSSRVVGTVAGLERWDGLLASVIWMACAVVTGGIVFRLGGGFGFVLVAFLVFVGRRLGENTFSAEPWVRFLDWWDAVAIKDIRSYVGRSIARWSEGLWRRVRAVRPDHWCMAAATVSILFLAVLPRIGAWSVSGSGSFMSFESALARVMAALKGTPFASGVRPVGLDVLLEQWNSLSHVNPLVLTLLWPSVCALVTVGCVMYVGTRLGGGAAAGIAAGLVDTVLTATGILPLPHAFSSAAVAPLLAVLAFHYTRRAIRSEDAPAAAWVASALLALAGLIGWLPFIDALLASLAAVLGYALGGGGLRRPVQVLMMGFPLAVLPGTLAIGWGFWTGRTVIPFWHSNDALPATLLGLLGLAAMALWVRQLWLTLGHRSVVSPDASAVMMLCGGVTLLAWAFPAAADPSLAVLAVSLAAAVLYRALVRSHPTWYATYGVASLCMIVSLFVLWRGISQPASAASQSTDATLTAYLRIESTLSADTWATVDTSPYELAAGQGSIYAPLLWVQQETPSQGSSEVSYAGHLLKVRHVFLFLRYLGSPGQESYADDELWTWYRSWLRDGGRSTLYFHGGNLTVFELASERTSSPRASP